MSKQHKLLKLFEFIDDEWTSERDYRIGQILTIIDASISDREQRKAIKDLIKNSLYDNYGIEGSYRLKETRQFIYSFLSKFSPEIIKSDEEDKKIIMSLILSEDWNVGDLLENLS